MGRNTSSDVPGFPGPGTLDDLRLLDAKGFAIPNNPMAGIVNTDSSGLATQEFAKGVSSSPVVDAGSWYDTGGCGGPIYVVENAQSLYSITRNHKSNRIIHIDPVDGNDANAGTRSSPKKTRNVAAWTGSVTTLQSYDFTVFKRGTTYIHNTGNAIEIGARQHCGAYGDPSIPRPILRSLNSASVPYVVGITQSGNDAGLSDLEIDASDVGDRSGILVSAAASAGAGNDMLGIVIRNMLIHGVTSAVSGTPPNATSDLRAGIRIVNNSLSSTNRLTDYPTMYDIDVIDTDVVGCGYHGFHTGGVIGKLIGGVRHGVRFKNCKSIGNATNFDGHGFSSFSQMVVRGVLQSYTLVTGTTYYLTTAQLFGGQYGVTDVPDVELIYVRAPATGEVFFLRKNTATPTTPAAGEFGFVGGSSGTSTNQRIYVNVGYALPTGTNTTAPADACVYSTKYIQYDRCLSKGTKQANQTGTFEGIGIAFDDFTSYCEIINSELIDNDGTGVSFNIGRSNTVLNSRFARNGRGSFGGVSVDSKVWGCWAEESGFITSAVGSSVCTLNSPPYYFTDAPSVVGGFRKLKYVGTTAGVFLVGGNPDFNAPALLFEDSAVDAGVGQICGYGTANGEGGLVLARGIIPLSDAARILFSPNYKG